jgi:uncharacterized protein
VSETQVIVDTGPLVAFLVREEIHHDWVKDQFRQLPAPFLTCEPVLTETFFLVRHLRLGPARFFALLNSGLLRADISVLRESANLEKLIQKYADVPMSLADACLVRLAELNPRATLFTLDDDFKIYRRSGREIIPTLMPSAK